MALLEIASTVPKTLVDPLFVVATLLASPVCMIRPRGLLHRQTIGYIRLGTTTPLSRLLDTQWQQLLTEPTIGRDLVPPVITLMIIKGLFPTLTASLTILVPLNKSVVAAPLTKVIPCFLEQLPLANFSFPAIRHLQILRQPSLTLRTMSPSNDPVLWQIVLHLPSARHKDVALILGSLMILRSALLETLGILLGSDRHRRLTG